MSSSNPPAPTLEWAPREKGSEKEQEWTNVNPLSVVKLLRLREMGGLPKFSEDRNSVGMIRLLVKSRAPAVTSEDKKGETFSPMKIKVRTFGGSRGTRKKGAEYKYTYLSLKTHFDKSNIKAMFVYDDVLLMDGRNGIMTIHVAEYNMWLSRALLKRYAVYGTNRENNSSMRTPPVKIDMMCAFKMRGNDVEQDLPILVVMSKSKISSYDLQSGNLLESVDLNNMDAPEPFTCTGLSCFENSVIGPCIKVERKRDKSKKSLPSDFEFEFLLISVMPMSVKYRIQIPKGALGRSIVKIETLDGYLLYCLKKVKVSTSFLCDIQSLIDINKETTVEISSPDLQFDEMKTVVVRHQPTFLASLNMQLSGINPWSCPPTALGSMANKELLVYSLADSVTPIHRIMAASEQHLEPLLSNYSEMSEDILLNGVTHGFSILELKKSKKVEEAEKMCMTCEETFSTEALLSPTEPNNSKDDNRSTRRSLRSIERKNYTSAAECDKLYFFEYDCVLNLFLVVEIDHSEKCIGISMYDNETKQLVRKLNPFCIKKHMPDGFFVCPVQSKVVINFAYFYIAISLSYISDKLQIYSSYIYFINLLGECVE